MLTEENIKDMIVVVFIPLTLWLIKLSNRISVLENEKNNTKDILKSIFEKLETNREDLHEVNTKTEKILSKIEKDK